MKRAPIHQFIKELKKRETAAIVLEAETPPLDRSKIPPNWTVLVEDSESVLIEEKIDITAPDCPIVVVPTDWIKGQLLNVRNNGAEYVITLLGEEFDPRYPERALLFTNPAECQNFVSRWYARENHDARAY